MDYEGIVDAVAPHERLDAEVQQWCGEVCDKSPTATAIAKRSFQERRKPDFRRYAN